MAWKNSWSKPASGDSWHCRFSHHTAKPPGFCTNSNTVVISTRELWTAIGDQHLAPGQTPVSYPHWALWNFMDVPTGKRTKKQVFLLILSLTARKSAESLSTNQEKNNAETANTNLLHQPYPPLKQQIGSQVIFLTLKTQGHRQIHISLVPKEKLSESNSLKVYGTRQNYFYNNNSCLWVQGLKGDLFFL